MGKDSSEIRREIEETRERMGETADAIGYKADVPSRVKENLSDRVGSVKSSLGDTAARIGDAVGSATSRVGNAIPDVDVRASARRAAGIVHENPLGLALGALAFGFLAGLMLPATRLENEKLGPVADQLKDQALSKAHDALDHGKQALHDVADAALDHGLQSLHEVASTPRYERYSSTGGTL